MNATSVQSLPAAKNAVPALMQSIHGRASGEFRVRDTVHLEVVGADRGFSTRSGLRRRRGSKVPTRDTDSTRCGLQVRAPAAPSVSAQFSPTTSRCTVRDMRFFFFVDFVEANRSPVLRFDLAWRSIARTEAAA